MTLTIVAGCAGTSESSPGPAWNCSARVELSTLWEELRPRHDANGDGVIERSEYGRGDVRFDNYDRTGDGRLTSDDFPTDAHFNGFNHMLVRDADFDEDERVTQEEWRQLCAEFDVDGDGRVLREELQQTMGRWAEDWDLFLLSFDQDGDGDFDDVDLAMTFRDQDFDGDGDLEGNELTGWGRTASRGDGEAPAAGEPAPDFELAYAGDPERTFRLSEHRARPVALIFGSYT